LQLGFDVSKQWSGLAHLYLASFGLEAICT